MLKNNINMDKTYFTCSFEEVKEIINSYFQEYKSGDEIRGEMSYFEEGEKITKTVSVKLIGGLNFDDDFGVEYNYYWKVKISKGDIQVSDYSFDSKEEVIRFILFSGFKTFEVKCEKY